MKRILLAVLLFLVCASGNAQWSWYPEKTELVYRCESCHPQYRDLRVNPDSLILGEALGLDIEYLDYASVPVWTESKVWLDGSRPDVYKDFMWYVVNVYGWIRMNIYTTEGIFTYVIPTWPAYEAVTTGTLH